MSFWVSVWTPPELCFRLGGLEFDLCLLPDRAGRAWTCTQGHGGLNSLRLPDRQRRRFQRTHFSRLS